MRLVFRLSASDCVTIGPDDFILHRQDQIGIVLCRIGDADKSVSFKHDEFMRLLDLGEVRLRRGYFASPNAARRVHTDHRYLNSLPPQVRGELLWKEAYCQAFLSAEAEGHISRTDSSIREKLPDFSSQVNARDAEWQVVVRKPKAGAPIVFRHPPSVTSLRRWVRRYEKFGHSPLALVRQRRGNQAFFRKLAKEGERLLADCVSEYQSPDQPTQLLIVERTVDRFKQVNRGRQIAGSSQLPIPSARTIRRRIAALDPFETFARRKGIDAARRKFSFYRNGVTATYPLERIEMDEWKIDLVSLFSGLEDHRSLSIEERLNLERGRRWAYVAIDCATKCVVSFVLVAEPSSEGAVRALELVTLDKTGIARAAGCEMPWPYFGGIGSIVCDQGSAFISAEFRTAATDLGSTYEAPPAGLPWMRGQIERLFGRFAQNFAARLVGRTFSNVEQRGDYPSEDIASLTDDELTQAFVIYIVDVYHHSPHGGLNGETPANAWRRLSHERGVTPPPDNIQRTAVFGEPLSRKVGRHGVRVLGIHYTCRDLEDLLLRGKGRDVAVRLNPHDLGSIAVLVGSEWRQASATADFAIGLSVKEWAETVREIRTSHRQSAALTEDMVARARLRIAKLDQAARDIMRVQFSPLSPSRIERLERELFLGVAVQPQAKIAISHNAEDLLGDVIEAPEQTFASQTMSDEQRSVDEVPPKLWRLSDV